MGLDEGRRISEIRNSTCISSKLHRSRRILSLLRHLLALATLSTTSTVAGMLLSLGKGKAVGLGMARASTELAGEGRGRGSSNSHGGGRDRVYCAAATLDLLSEEGRDDGGLVQLVHEQERRDEVGVLVR